MPPLDLLMPFILASALLSIAPGPDNLFVLTQSALYGRRSGILITMGLCSGLVVHTIAVALGVAVIFQTSELAFNTLKYLGACYLIYLAWMSFKASAQNLDAPSPKLISAGQLYGRGVIMNITNPKVSIFFLAFLPQFASVEVGPLAPQIFVLGALFMAVSFLIFSAIAILAGSLGDWLQNSPKAQIYLNRLAGIVFIGLAANLLLLS